MKTFLVAPRSLPVLVGGFFVLIGFMGLRASPEAASVPRGVRADAPVTIFVGPSEAGRAMLIERRDAPDDLGLPLRDLFRIFPDTIALVGFTDPFEFGAIVRGTPKRLTELARRRAASPLIVRPLTHGLIVLGATPTLGDRQKSLRPMPFWNRLELGPLLHIHGSIVRFANTPSDFHALESFFGPN